MATEPKGASGLKGASVGGAVTGGTSGSVLFVNSSGQMAQDNQYFYYDSTAKQLRLGGGGDVNPLRIDLLNGSANKYIDFTYGNNAGSYGSFVQVGYGLSMRAGFNLSFFPAAANGVFIGRETTASDATAPAKLNVVAGSAAQSAIIATLADSQTADAVDVFASDNATKLFKVDANGSTTTKGLRTNAVTVTTTYSILSTDYFICANTTGGAFTVTLPTAVGAAGQQYVVKDCNGTAGTNNITIATTSSQTIDGATTKTINTNYASISVFSDNANWKIF